MKHHIKILFALPFLGFLLVPIRGFTQEQASNVTDSSHSAYFQQKARLYFEEANRISSDSTADKSEKAIRYYKLSTQNWQKAIDLADPVSMKLYRNLGMAQYRGGDYKAVNETLRFIERRKEENQVQPIIRCFTSSNKNTDPSSLILLAEKLVRDYGDKATDLKPQQLQTILVSMEALALKAFDPVGSNDPKDYDCAAAKAHIDKINALNPGYINTRAGLKGVSDFCAQQ